MVAFIRVGIELIIKYGAVNIMGLNFHYHHVIRLMEFYLGMLIFYFLILIFEYNVKTQKCKIMKVLLIGMNKNINLYFKS